MTRDIDTCEPRRMPGPWLRVDADGQTEIRDEHGALICIMPARMPFGLPMPPDDLVRIDRHARLIAAAPDILAALRAGVRWMEQAGAHAPETFADMRDAIARAEGG